MPTPITHLCFAFALLCHARRSNDLERHSNFSSTIYVWKVVVSFKIIMTTSVTRPCFTTAQHKTCKTKTKTTVRKTEIKTRACKTKTKTESFWSQTGLVLKPTVSDHIIGQRVVIHSCCCDHGITLACGGGCRVYVIC